MRDGTDQDTPDDAPPVGSPARAGLAPLYVDTLLRAHAYTAAAGLGGVVALAVTAAVLSAADVMVAWPAVLLVAVELAGTIWVARRANRVDREFESMATEL